MGKQSNSNQITNKRSFQKFIIRPPTPKEGPKSYLPRQLLSKNGQLLPVLDASRDMARSSKYYIINLNLTTPWVPPPKRKCADFLVPMETDSCLPKSKQLLPFFCCWLNESPTDSFPPHGNHRGHEKDCLDSPTSLLAGRSIRFPH